MGTSPAHYSYHLTHPLEDTDAMLLGRAVHTAVLEPDSLPLEYAVWRGGKRVGAEWKEFAGANADRDILTEVQYEKALAIRDAVRSHPVAAQLLAKGDAEVPLTWTDAETGLACKCRVDWLTGRSFVDLKTTRDLSERRFANTIEDLAYFGQLAFYRMGVGALLKTVAEPPLIIGVESEAPHDVGVFAVSSDWLWAGDDLAHELLAKVAECTASGEWPGRYPKKVTLERPYWASDGENDVKDLVSFGGSQ
jgi:hypothetical protein